MQILAALSNLVADYAVNQHLPSPAVFEVTLEVGLVQKPHSLELPVVPDVFIRQLRLKRPQVFVLKMFERVLVLAIAVAYEERHTDQQFESFSEGEREYSSQSFGCRVLKFGDAS